MFLPTGAKRMFGQIKDRSLSFEKGKVIVYSFVPRNISKMRLFKFLCTICIARV